MFLLIYNNVVNSYNSSKLTVSEITLKINTQDMQKHISAAYYLSAVMNPSRSSSVNVL